MNTVVTSKEEILRASRELIRQKGWDAVNIRSVAAACGVSVGSIYNYFDSKAALVERPDSNTADKSRALRRERSPFFILKLLLLCTDH